MAFLTMSLKSGHRHLRHPWHLVRCRECRKLILNATPKCPYCAAWQPDARAFSIGFTFLLSVCAVGLLVLGWESWVRLEQRRQAEQELILLERLQHASPPTRTAR